MRLDILLKDMQLFMNMNIPLILYIHMNILHTHSKNVEKDVKDNLPVFLLSEDHQTFNCAKTDDPVRTMSFNGSYWHIQWDRSGGNTRMTVPIYGMSGAPL